MNATLSNPAPVLAVLRQQAGMVQQVFHLNIDGVTQEQSMIQPQPAGNCLNWVAGHLLAVYHNVLPLLGQQPVMPPEQLRRYSRGSAPMQRMEDAIGITELTSAWDETCARIDAGIAALTADDLAHPAPVSPSGDPNETVGSLLATVCWHQAYHAGQLGVLRRMAGKEGAIK
jgi:uncharacterized damage-inducible protein DinB